MRCRQIGTLDCSYEKAGRIYDSRGISPTIESRDYKDPKLVAVYGESLQGHSHPRLARLAGTTQEGLRPGLLFPDHPHGNRENDTDQGADT